MSRLCPDTVSSLLTNISTDPNEGQSIGKVIIAFAPIVSKMASSFSRSWKKDLVQEGNLGLFLAIRNYIEGKIAKAKFIPYAIAAIRSKMINLYKRIVSNAYLEVPTTQIDGPVQRSLIPILQEWPSRINSLGEKEDIDFPDVDYHRFEFEHDFNSTTLRNLGWSELEIHVYGLFFSEGYGVCETAEILSISPSYASKLVHRVHQYLTAAVAA